MTIDQIKLKLKARKGKGPKTRVLTRKYIATHANLMAEVGRRVG